MFIIQDPVNSILAETNYFFGVRVLFQMVHKCKVAEYTEYKKSCAKKRPADSSAEQVATDSGLTPKRVHRQTTVKERMLAAPVNQDKLDDLVMDYIIQELRPLCTVEKPAFRNLILGLSPSHTVMSRKTLNKRLSEKNAMLLYDIRQQLADQSAVCTTADIWSCMHKSYLGVTAHWISHDLNRRSVALACARLKGSHTYDVVADHLMIVHSQFGLDHTNISFTVTDNGSNFVKAFAEYHETEEVRSEESDDGVGYDDDSVEDTDANLQVVDVDSVLVEECPHAVDIFLPKHMRCASHTMNLLATNDFQKIISADSGSYKRLIRSAMAKCSKLWTNVSRSTKAADTVEAITKLSLRSPGETRWNATYDAIKRLLDPRVCDKIPVVMDALKMPRFQKIEMEVLQEYLLVMAPIAQALDKLQGEHDCYLGLLMPTIQQIKKKLAAVSATVEHSGPLVDGLIKSLEARFTHLFEFSTTSKVYAVSSVCHPNFKLRWVPVDKKEWVKAAFLEEAIKHSTSLPDASATATQDVSDDFFDFDDNAPAEANPDGQSAKVLIQFEFYLDILTH